MKTVYIETSIISYLTARAPRDVVGAARRQLTIDWWDTKKAEYELYISSVVEDEASKGDESDASRRLAEIDGLMRLPVTGETEAFAQTLLENKALPADALDDALHISLAAIHGMDYLLTWNFRHIDNAHIKPLIRHRCSESGFPYPEICTPEELMGDL